MEKQLIIALVSLLLSILGVITIEIFNILITYLFSLGNTGWVIIFLGVYIALYFLINVLEE